METGLPSMPLEILQKESRSMRSTASACHGPQGKGDGPAGKMLKPPAADFTRDPEVKRSPRPTLEASGRKMESPALRMGPWKGQLSHTEMNDVMEYVMALRK